MKIKTLDKSSVKRVFGLVAGNAGCGKTTQATTFPKKETLIISVEDGLLSIEGSGYAIIECDSYNSIMEVIENPPKWVKYLYIDSLSEVYAILKKELSTKYTKSQNFAKFDEMNLSIFSMVRTARQLPIDVFFTCHTKEEKNGLSLEEELAFDGKMPADLKKQFDLIVHMKMIDDGDKTERKFITSPELSKVAKRRVSPWSGIKVNDVEDADLYKLTQKLKGIK